MLLLLLMDWGIGLSMSMMMRDRQITTTDPTGGTTVTQYDDLGNVLSITDPVGNTTTYTYDERNRVTSDTNELGYIRTFVYDAVGNQVATTDRNGRERSFTYDALNRQIEENWLNDEGNTIRTTTSTYDAASQLIAISDPDSSYTLEYDQLGRLIAIDNAGTPGVANVVLNYTYDNNGNIIEVRDTINGVDSGITTYSYDELNRTS